MSAVVDSYRDETDVSYAVDFGRDRGQLKKQGRFPDYRRKGSAPARVSGMHCRRNKRWTWGSGRGARTLNARAFAGCLAWLVVTAASTAFGVTIDLKTIGNPGNAANPATGLGDVSGIFRMATFETTNDQYTEFLNRVDAAGTNPNSIYQPSAVISGSTVLNPITLNSGASSGSKYSVAPANAAKPVVFVSWFSAARFANWLNNGQQANSSSMETGAYTLNNLVSGSAVPRNPGASFFLPNADEWTKAAYYNATGSGSYRTFPYASTAPNAVTTGTGVLGTNAANYGLAQGRTTGLTEVSLYTNSKTWYDVAGMFGNAGEITETGVNATSVTLLGSSWRLGTGAVGTWSSNSANNTYATNAFSDSIGFRVAAVPEPTTIALAGIGIVSLGGLEWMKRRKRRAIVASQLSA